MKQFLLFSCVCLLFVILLFTVSQETSPLPAGAGSGTTSQLVKGSGSFLSGELRETGEFLLSVQDEVEPEKRYVVPKDLTVQKGDAEIRPSELKQGDILDIDYFLSEKGERVVTHLDIVISDEEKKMHVDVPALESKPKETP